MVGNKILIFPGVGSGIASAIAADTATPNGQKAGLASSYPNAA